MGNLLIVCAGGAIGAGARYLAGLAAIWLMGPGFPWATIFVNIVGSFVMGIFGALLLGEIGLSTESRLFIMTGILGGFTTFSAYALDVVVLAERGDWVEAIAYASASVVGSVAALVIGLSLARGLSA